MAIIPWRRGAIVIAILTTWSCGGTPRDDPGDAGHRGPDTAVDVGDDPVTCSSGVYWTGGNAASTRMRPGTACIACHTATPGGPPFVIAGTVYLTRHEPDDCYGVSADVQVEITDVAGRVLLLPVNSAGNFFQFASAPFDPPFRSRVLSAGGVRTMVRPQASGDCNSCHTQRGANEAPGRIIAR